MKTAKLIAAVTATAIAAMVGCKKEHQPAYGYMAVQMSQSGSSQTSSTARSADLPTAVYSSVDIDLLSVSVHYSDETQGSGGWVSLNTKAGVYDLMTLKNNVMAAITQDTKLPVGYITQIRLMLGPNNSVVISSDGGQVQPLTVPSGIQTGIKINLNTTIEKDKHVTITLDFDANASVVAQGNGTYSLKPVISVQGVAQN